MADQQACREQCMAAFDKGVGGKPIDAGARGWIERFCDEWLSAKEISKVWNREHNGESNGKMFENRFKKIGQAAVQKCDTLRSTQITMSEVESATQEVVEASACPFCPDI